MKTNLAVVFLLIPLASSAAVTELHVVKTEPEAGFDQVPAGLTRVVIHFNAPVKRNSWSFVEIDSAEFPQVTGDPTFESETVCVLPVKLKPDTSYGLGINSRTRKGFKSAEDEQVTCAPYRLMFKTGKGEADTAKPRALDKTEESKADKMAGKTSPRKDKDLITMVFEKYEDRSENAFTFLIPRGWLTEGGIIRVNPILAGGPAQSLEAAFGFAARKDDAGTVMIRWLPHVYYADTRFMPAGNMFPPGSNYMGMTVFPYPEPQDFLTQFVFPYLHTGAENPEIIERKDLPQLAGLFRRFFKNYLAPYLPVPLDFQYEAGMVSMRYQENGVVYRETSVAVLENRGAIAGGQWCNRYTLVARAPEKEFAAWEPVFQIISDSGQINPAWAAGEIQGQIQRGEILIRTQEEIQKIEQAIVDNRQKTNAEIHNDMYLNLTGQEEYINPFTNKTEIGSNEWNYRWQNELGHIIYTDDMNYDPNRDPALQVQGYKKSPVRPR
ncbi:MAG: hypothetical protein ACE15F_12515 [bacterium]